MRIFGARIFSTSFGGKIVHFQADVNYLEYFNKIKKKRRMRILGARIFLSLLAGKFESFKQGLAKQNTVWSTECRDLNKF